MFEREDRRAGVGLAVQQRGDELRIAIGAGAADGFGLGDNSKSALITRGLVEITRLGVAMGAKPETFAGLAGLGDLVTTCVSPLDIFNNSSAERGTAPPTCRSITPPFGTSP